MGEAAHVFQDVGLERGCGWTLGPENQPSLERLSRQNISRRQTEIGGGDLIWRCRVRMREQCSAGRNEAGEPCSEVGLPVRDGHHLSVI